MLILIQTFILSVKVVWVQLNSNTQVKICQTHTAASEACIKNLEYKITRYTCQSHDELMYFTTSDICLGKYINCNINFTSLTQGLSLVKYLM